MISPRMLMAISSGVAAPMSSPIGRAQAGDLLGAHPGLSEAAATVLVRLPAADSADIGGRRVDVPTSAGSSNLGSWERMAT